MVWRKENPSGSESRKICWELVPYTRGRGFDLGCGPEKAFPHFRGIDSNKDEQLFGIRATGADFIVPTCEVLDEFSNESQDFVFSSHLLEHIEDYKGALKEWWRVLKVGGYLCLYLPHKNFYPNIGTDGANPDHKHDFLPKDIIEAMKDYHSWDLVENQERNGKGCFNLDEYSFFQVYCKTDDYKHKQSWTSPKPKKTAAICRYGAIGDVIQTGSIAASLKAQGYHVTLYCDPRGFEIAEHDPNYDAFCVQDKDQVPNQLLGEFWPYVAKKYDKWINLSESVEASLLVLPDRIGATWSQPMRHKYLDHNYLEFMHDIAGTQYQWFKDGQRFVQTKEEKEWAKEERSKISGAAVLWALAGSSVHKTWPWIDVSLARLLTATDATIITTGDKTTQALEQFPGGIEKGVTEGRIWKRAGKLEIRKTLALALECDLVIGPETGVLNAVAMEKNIAKIVLLSHSSVNNLTRDWVNTISLEPKNTSCYPCHRLHYGWESCRREPEGVAACQKDISPDQMWEAISQSISEEHFTMKDKRVIPIAAA